MNLIYAFKEHLDTNLYLETVKGLRDACLNFAENKVDDESLRVVTKKDLNIFIHNIESILCSAVNMNNKESD